MNSNLKECGGRMSNINHYIDWFNRLTYLTASEVLRCSKRQSRVRTIEYFIEVARECINYANFNSFMAIVAALSLPLIGRLKKTWSRVDKSKLEILLHQYDPTANFASYRSTLKAAIWRFNGTTNETHSHIFHYEDFTVIFIFCFPDINTIFRAANQRLIIVASSVRTTVAKWAFKL
ncbi:unnamed protein product [Gongylonema pulchrum]|uniref:Ras-GEF domain-containing protein n=1 Tax=Gongylonema pulchrum TaxID=637853 RepID=A0A183DGJ6_9BILA|nr:unnamed protein product [Gongylonema pulchrum]